MVDAEILKVLGQGPRCLFRYTSAGRPGLAVSAAADDPAVQGVVKLNGHLVGLRRTSTDGPLVLSAEEIRLTVTTDDGEPADSPRRREAILVFEIGDELRVGYRGYYACVE